jgi:hypothetical protein
MGGAVDIRIAAVFPIASSAVDLVCCERLTKSLAAAIPCLSRYRWWGGSFSLRDSPQSWHPHKPNATNGPLSGMYRAEGRFYVDLSRLVELVLRCCFPASDILHEAKPSET